MAAPRASSSLTADDVRLPSLMYGTAWKDQATARLTRQALDAGFRGIDTANQRKHYFEAGVGEAIQGWLQAGGDRDDLFIQTKFTHLSGQDARLPYDPKASVATQVRQSFDSSLEHLGVERLDALLMHGPSVAVGLHPDDWAAWEAMEAVARGGGTRLLGVSNVSFEQLVLLHEAATIKPAVVQNRCFTRPHADVRVREFCRENGMAYQGFSLLTAIPQVLRHPPVVQMAQGLGLTPAQVVFAYCLQRGMTVLTGTTSAQHMAQDLAAGEVVLSQQDASLFDRIFER